MMETDAINYRDKIANGSCYFGRFKSSDLSCTESYSLLKATLGLKCIINICRAKAQLTIYKFLLQLAKL